MPQLRLMGDDPDSVDRVLAVLLPLMRAHPQLQVGEPARLRHRGGGGRVVVDVTAPPAEVTVDRVDGPRSRGIPR